MNKFINYTREAFFWPFHLSLMAGLGAAAGVVAGAGLLTPMAALFLFGGAELMLLGTISQNTRFVRAINAKYQKDIDNYYKTRTIVDYYNALSYKSQSRFNKLKATIQEIREGYKKVSKVASPLINRFLTKLNSIEYSYVRLLYFKEKFPEHSQDDLMKKTRKEYNELLEEVKSSTGRIREVRIKRLKLLKRRLESQGKVKENREVIEEQLQTIEEMVDYIKDQPMTIQNTDREDIMIDNLLFETEQTQESLEELESLMRSEFSPELSGDLEAYNEDWLKE